MTNGAVSEDAADAPVTPRSLWSNRPYQFLMWGNTTAAVGLSLAMFAVPLVAYAVTHSILLSGLVTAAGEIGALIALLPSGVLADRADRRMLLIWSAAVGLVIWGCLAVLQAMHMLNGWEIAAALLVGTVFTTIFEAAESAAIRVVVPPRQMPTAMAVNQGRSATASLAGAPVGGLLYALGALWPLASGAVANAVSLVTALFIRTSLGPEPSTTRTHPLTDLREGFRFVWSVPFRRFMLFFGAFINFSLIGVATAVNLHLVATGTLPVLIGLVDVAVGVGMLLGSFVASSIIQRVPTGPLGIYSFIALVIGTAGVAAAPDVWWYLPALFEMGFALAIVNSAFGGYNAVITPKRIMGRAGMIGRLGSTIIGPIAPVAGSWLLDWLGMHVTGIVFTVWLAVFVAITALNPALRRVGKPDTWEADAERMAAEYPEFS